MDCINGAVLKSIEDVGGRDTAVTGNTPGFGLLQCTMYNVLRIRLGRVAHWQLHTRALAKVLEIKKGTWRLIFSLFLSVKPLGDKIFTCTFNISVKLTTHLHVYGSPSVNGHVSCR